MKKRNVQKGAIIIIVLIFIIACAIAAFIIREKSNKVEPNPLSAVGNTGGNLQNSGLFVSSDSDGRIYFSNLFDRGYIYSMNSDETDIRLEVPVCSNKMLSAGDYLYYYMDSSGGGQGIGYVVKTHGMYRYKKGTDKIVCLSRDPILAMQLIGNEIFFLKSDEGSVTRTYKMATEKSEPQKISDSIIYPYTARDAVIYFSGNENDHFLYAFDTRSSSVYTAFQGDLCNPQYVGGYMYYMDFSGNYRICRYNTGTHNVEILTKDRVDMFNVSDSFIFYQKNDKENPCLMRMNLDGSNPSVVANGLFCDINVTDRYVYFRSYDDKTKLYHAPLSGGTASEFTAAREAVKE